MLYHSKVGTFEIVENKGKVEVFNWLDGRLIDTFNTYEEATQMIQFLESENNMEIENLENMVIIYEDLTEFYNEKTNDLEGAPIRWENGELIDIDDEATAIEKKEGFKLYVLDGLGNIEKVIE